MHGTREIANTVRTTSQSRTPRSDGDVNVDMCSKMQKGNAKDRKHHTQQTAYQQHIQATAMTRAHECKRSAAHHRRKARWVFNNRFPLVQYPVAMKHIRATALR